MDEHGNRTIVQAHVTLSSASAESLLGVSLLYAKHTSALAQPVVCGSTADAQHSSTATGHATSYALFTPLANLSADDVTNRCSFFYERVHIG